MEFNFIYIYLLINYNIMSYEDTIKELKIRILNKFTKGSSNNLEEDELNLIIKFFFKEYNGRYKNQNLSIEDLNLVYDLIPPMIRKYEDKKKNIIMRKKFRIIDIGLVNSNKISDIERNITYISNKIFRKGEIFKIFSNYLNISDKQIINLLPIIYLPIRDFYKLKFKLKYNKSDFSIFIIFPSSLPKMIDIFKKELSKNYICFKHKKLYLEVLTI